MKTLTQKLCYALCLSSTLISGGVLASSSHINGGVIHFVGQIVDGPCDIATHSRNISMNCYNNGRMKTSSISYQQALVDGGVNNDMTTVSMHYINPQKTLGVVTVVYR